MADVSTISMTVEDFLQIEREADVRHELFRGEVREMPGGTISPGSTISHSRVVADLVRVLGNLLEAAESPCEVLESNMRLLTPTELVTYPDLTVLCGPELLADSYSDTLLNPTVICEVLSPSTETFDRGEKFEEYSSFESLRAYVLLASTRPVVEVFQRTSSTDDWLYRRVVGNEASFSIESIGIEVPLANIYKRISVD